MSSSSQTQTSTEENLAYLDPPNTDAIIEALKNAEMHNSVVSIITNTFPNWIIGNSKRFSEDYPHFQDNWEYICKKSGCEKPLDVIIVDFLVFNNPRYKLCQIFAELLTLFGHSVRRKEEFIACKVCKNAIPTQNVYNQLIERKIKVPTYWMTKCTGC
jgi:hypothetical protein